MKEFANQQDILLSIVIPVYNIQDYLEECIDSIVNQKRDRIEVVLVDDGSTDESFSICLNYSIKYPYIKVIRQENKGLSAARNTGINNAIGKYLLLLDSDDYLNLNALESVFSIIENDSPDFIFGNLLIKDDKSQVTILSKIDYSIFSTDKSPAEIYLELRKHPEYFQSAWLVIPRRDFILENNLFFEVGLLHEDELWVPQVFTLASNMTFLNYPFYVYRINRKGSIMNSISIKNVEHEFIIIDKLDTKASLLDGSKKSLRYSMAALLYSIMVQAVSFNSPDREYLWEKVQERIDLLKIDKYRILYVTYKILGYSLFVRIWDFIELSKMLDERYQIVLAGTDKIIPGIITIPRTNSKQELAEIYTAADVFLNLSREETFGMTTIEALACGTKAIVYKGTAAEEIAVAYGVRLST